MARGFLFGAREKGGERKKTKKAKRERRKEGEGPGEAGGWTEKGKKGAGREGAGGFSVEPSGKKGKREPDGKTAFLFFVAGVGEKEKRGPEREQPGGERRRRRFVRLCNGRFRLHGRHSPAVFFQYSVAHARCQEKTAGQTVFGSLPETKGFPAVRGFGVPDVPEGEISPERKFRVFPKKITA